MEVERFDADARIDVIGSENDFIGTAHDRVIELARRPHRIVVEFPPCRRIVPPCRGITDSYPVDTNVRRAEAAYSDTIAGVCRVTSEVLVDTDIIPGSCTKVKVDNGVCLRAAAEKYAERNESRGAKMFSNFHTGSGMMVKSLCLEKIRLTNSIIAADN